MARFAERLSLSANGDLGDASVLYGFGVVTALALLALWWAARSFRRATA